MDLWREAVRAGQRIQTAGKVPGPAGKFSGLHSTRKNEYNITVLRGPSRSEIILAPQKIGYTGMTTLTVLIALADEGVERRKEFFGKKSPDGLVIQVAGIDIPDTRARVVTVDFKSLGIRKPDRAMASLAVPAKLNLVISPDMPVAGIEENFKGQERIIAAVKTVIGQAAG